MAQVLVLCNTPAEPAAFDRYYHEKHIPLARKIPGLGAYLISSSPVQALGGSAPYLVAILNFDSMADLSAALASPEGPGSGGRFAELCIRGRDAPDLRLQGGLRPQGTCPYRWKKQSDGK